MVGITIDGEFITAGLGLFAIDRPTLHHIFRSRRRGEGDIIAFDDREGLRRINGAVAAGKRSDIIG